MANFPIKLSKIEGFHCFFDKDFNKFPNVAFCYRVTLHRHVILITWLFATADVIRPIVICVVFSLLSSRDCSPTAAVNQSPNHYKINSRYGIVYKYYSELKF